MEEELVKVMSYRFDIWCYREQK